MTYMNGNSRARVNPRGPQAFSCCDRCGDIRNWVDLTYQYYWAGTRLRNTGFLVCPPCLDIPNENTRTIFIPPDPLPVINARPAPWLSQEGSPPPAPPTPVQPIEPDIPTGLQGRWNFRDPLQSDQYLTAGF